MQGLTANLLSAALLSLWLGAGLALAATLLLRLAPGLPPTWRYRVWGAVLLCIALPLVRGTPRLDPPPPGGTAPARPSAAPPVAAAPLEAEPPPSTGAASVGEPPAILRAPDRSPEPVAVRDPTAWLPAGLAATLVALLVTGCMLLMLRLTGQLRAVRRLKRRALPPAEGLRRQWVPALHLLPVSRPVDLRCSPDVALPVACGFRRPAILFPAGLDRSLTPREIRCLLLHELAHLGRKDDWALLCERALLALLWWNPAAHWASRCIEQEREQACDALVAGRSDRRVYARTLVRVAEMVRGTAPALAPGAHRGSLSLRIERLLAAPGPSRGGHWRRRAAGALGGVTLAAAVVLRPPTVRTFTARATVAEAPSGARDRATIREMDQVFARYADSGFSGTVLLAQHGSVLLARGYGQADRERGIAATAETRYSTAGFTKLFTATALLDLVHEERLSLDDTLGRWFPSLPPAKAGVTLGQVLTYQDGLTRPKAPVQRDEATAFVEAIGAAPASFTPGTAFRYNDHGHSLLGLIIERATGERFEDYIRRRYLGPAGLSHTGFEGEGGPMAVEYHRQAGVDAPIGPRAYRWGRRASLGLVSTAGDLFRWFRALDDPTIVSPQTRRALFQVYGPTDYGSGQGYGLELVARRDGRRLWRRVAGTPGFEGELLYDPEGDWIAIILVNSRLGWRFRIWRDIERAMWEGTVTRPPGALPEG